MSTDYVVRVHAKLRIRIPGPRSKRRTPDDISALIEGNLIQLFDPPPSSPPGKVIRHRIWTSVKVRK